VTRFHAQSSFEFVASTSTHDFTDAGQSTFAPVANTLAANAITDGFADVGVGLASV
jgi:hypothetical protein